MYNSIYKYLGVLLLTLFFVFPVHADVGERIEIIKYTSDTVTKTFGDTKLGVCDKRTLTNSLYIASSTVRMYRTGTPTGHVYGVIYSPAGNPATKIATSTNWYLGTDIGTGATYPVFYFDNVLVSSSTSFCVGIETEFTDAVNYYYIWTGNTGQRINSDFIYSGLTSSSVGAEIHQEVYGYTYFPTCEGGGTLECDMASTTEAVYAVGYSINLYMGIFIALLFGYMAFIFFKKFIP